MRAIFGLMVIATLLVVLAALAVVTIPVTLFVRAFDGVNLSPM